MAVHLFCFPFSSIFLSATVPSGFSAYAYSVPCIFSVICSTSPGRAEEDSFWKVQNSYGLRPCPDHVLSETDAYLGCTDSPVMYWTRFNSTGSREWPDFLFHFQYDLWKGEREGVCVDLCGFTHRPEVSPGYQINEVGAKRDPRLSREKGAMTCSRSDLFVLFFSLPLRPNPFWADILLPHSALVQLFYRTLGA